MTEQAVVTTRRSLQVIGTATVVDDEVAVAWAGPLIATGRRPDHALLLGRYVQANVPNRNGHTFLLADLRDAHHTIRATPLNMLHQRQRPIGTFTGSELLYPEGSSAADALHGGAPYVEALASQWKHLFPDDFDKIMRASKDGLLFFSMEAVGRTMSCGDTACCGRTWPYQGVVHDDYCRTINQGLHAVIGGPHFLGGATIVPPTRPGWGHADIHQIAAMVDRHERTADILLDLVASAGPHLTPVQVEETMAMILAGALLDGGEPGQPEPVAAPYLIPYRHAEVEAAGDDKTVAICVRAPGTDPVQVTLAVAGGVIAEFGGKDADPSKLLVEGQGWAATGDVIVGAVAAAVAGAPRLTAEVVGDIATVKGPTFVAPVDVPGLEELQARIIERLTDVGVAVTASHGLVVVAWDELKIPTEPWSVSAIDVRFGSDVHVLCPLTGADVVVDEGMGVAVPADPVAPPALIPDASGLFPNTAGFTLTQTPTLPVIPTPGLEARDFPAEQRRKYADKGIAMRDGSFPIPDRDALRRAIRLAGNAKDPAAARRHIMKRARALGAEDMIPDSWRQ